MSRIGYIERFHMKSRPPYCAPNQDVAAMLVSQVTSTSGVTHKEFR